MTTAAATPKKTLDADIRERVEQACRSIMDDHPEVEAVGVMFLSKQLLDILPAMIVCGGAGPPLRPDQNVRLFEVWVRVGTQLMINHQRDIKVLDARLADYARSFAHVKAEAEGAQQQRTGDPQPPAGSQEGSPGAEPR